ncbi:MAG: hypothetical protein E7462_03530 [Ruminococcaceae bacterium]|nr:hypothetical protein [Oscillospiraceae bacterium]
MKRKRRNSNRNTLIAIAVFAVVVFASVPFVGNWIIDSFIQPQPPTEPTGSVPTVDTLYLTAEPKHVTVNGSVFLEAEEFVTNIQSTSAVTVTFASQPDWSLEGTQTVSVCLTDAAGNTATIDSTLTVDRQAPVIAGTKNLEAYVGGTVSYKTGVTVTDNLDGKPTLEIDNSQVDLSKAGSYTVTYKAVDAAGNVQTVSVQLKVKEKPANFVEPDVIYKRVDALLAKFITEDMTDREKAEAVYVWTRRAASTTPNPGHFTYSGSTSRHDDYLQAAYEFLDLKKGDCFYFYAIQKLMLERLNIPTIDAQKVKQAPNDSNHYWLLVSIDGGKTYYHYDNVWSWSLCLVTDAVVNSFTVEDKDMPDGISYPFNRDQSLYPATPTEKLPPSELPWDNAAIANAKP